MPTDNIQFSAGFKGRKDEVEGGLAKAVEEELMKRIGLEADVVSFLPEQTFTVALKPVGGGDDYVGRSNESIEDAIVDATKKGKLVYDQTEVNVSVKRIVLAPYFTIPITVRSLDQKKLEREHSETVDNLRNTYGDRLNPTPASIIYAVFKVKEMYESDDKIPDGEIGEVLARGESNKSIDDAVDKAEKEMVSKKIEKVKSGIYEQTAKMIVYGEQEQSIIAVEPREVGVGGAVGISVVGEKSAKDYARAGSPAARDPAYFRKAAGNLM